VNNCHSGQSSDLAGVFPINPERGLKLAVSTENGGWPGNTGERGGKIRNWTAHDVELYFRDDVVEVVPAGAGGGSSRPYLVARDGATPYRTIPQTEGYGHVEAADVVVEDDDGIEQFERQVTSFRLVQKDKSWTEIAARLDVRTIVSMPFLADWRAEGRDVRLLRTTGRAVFDATGKKQIGCVGVVRPR